MTEAPTRVPERDSQILAIFLAADDALQGILWLHFYTVAIHNQVMSGAVVTDDKLRIQLKVTHEWAREVSLKEFVSQMVNSFEFVHCRATLLSVIPNFDIALRRMKKRLSNLGKLGPTAPNYNEPDSKSLLRWAFQLVQNTDSGSTGMRGRLPSTCGDIDNARRLRNLSLHNNHKYNERYITDTITDAGVEPQYLGNHVVGVEKAEPFFLTDKDVERLACSHIEFLHMLHNTIQKKFFGCKEDYNYAKEGKQAELDRMVSGRMDVGV